MSDIDTGTEDLLATVEDNVAVITMNRPQARNALSEAMVEGMQIALEYAETSPEVRAVVITGAGGAFCAGGDIKGMAAGTGGGGPTTGTRDERIYMQRLQQRNTAGRLHRMPKPTVALIPGPAAGAGLSLALACDLRVMAESTFVTTAFARVGFSGDYGGTYFLTQLVGPSKARELYFLSDRVSAEECLRLGIVSRVVPDDQLVAETMALAQRLAEGPTVAYRYMKENINRALVADAIECMDLEVTHHTETAMTEDHREAAKAFVEKREPVFKGR